jgi:hypothetical protein
VVNVDGRDAAREMGRLARGVLSWSNGARSAPPMPSIADNAALAGSFRSGTACARKIIAYGADHARRGPRDISDLGLPRSYALAIARAEPENNLEVLIRAFGRMPDRPLVIVANWSATRHGRFCARPGRARGTSTWSRPNTIPAASARSGTGRGSTSMAIPGGTNPSLVEMMPFAVPILTWDCAYNRATTAGSAPGFRDVGGLIALVSRLAQRPDTCAAMGAALAGGGAQVSLGCHSRRLFRPSGPLIRPCRFPSGTPRPISGPPSKETDDAPRHDRPQDRGDRDFRRD